MNKKVKTSKRGQKSQQKRQRQTRNQLKRQKTRKNRKTQRKNRKNNRRNKMKGGAIPFSELGLAYDNVKYGVGSVTTALGDNTPSAPNNPISKNVNPNPTSQFNRTTSKMYDIVGSNLGEMFKNAFGE
tara:strand:- start:319 stop:702 length:384 start_codon:yes stop_codon:yes gene_type:complete